MRERMMPDEDADRGQRGITLVELVVAIVVLSIGTLAALGGLQHSTRELGQAQQRLLAQNVALNRAAELKLLGLGAAAPADATVQMGRHGFQTRVELERTDGGLMKATITARSDAGVGSVFVTYVSTVPR